MHWPFLIHCHNKCAVKANLPTKLNLVLTVLSAALLTLSFPDFELGFLAYIALVVLFIAINGKSNRSSDV